MAKDIRKAVAARDAAFARVRRTTVGVVAVGAALTAALTALAASSTHFAKATRVVHRVVRRAPAHKTAPKPVVAPAPPLVGNGSTAATPPPAAPSQAQAPAPAPAAPVVVSGGS